MFYNQVPQHRGDMGPMLTRLIFIDFFFQMIGPSFERNDSPQVHIYEW